MQDASEAAGHLYRVNVQEIDEIRTKVRTALWDRIALVKWIWRFVELVLIIGGSGVAVIVGFLGGTEPLTTADWVGMIGAALAVVGGIAIWAAKEPAEGLAEAQDALDHLSDSQRRFRDMEDYTDTLESGLRRMSALYVAFSTARGDLETAVVNGIADELGLIAHCLKTMKSDLRISIGLEMTDEWTIGVYQREIDAADGVTYLRLIAQDRSTECDPTKARRWPQGVGVGGMALAKDAEVVAPDIQAYEAKGMFALDGAGLYRPDDLVRYRSLIAVPIRVGDDTLPWGVVLVSSSRPGHFGYEDDEERQRPFPEEGARLLAGVVALAVALCRSTDPKKSSDVLRTTLAEGELT